MTAQHMLKEYLFRGLVGGLFGGLTGFGYHSYVVNNSSVCISCDKTPTPIIAGTIAGVILACFGRR